MAKHGDEQIDPGMVVWLVELGRRDRETYRRLRALAWRLVQANPECSANPNERS